MNSIGRVITFINIAVALTAVTVAAVRKAKTKQRRLGRGYNYLFENNKDDFSKWLFESAVK